MNVFPTVEQAKAHLKGLLEATDYAVLPDVNIANKETFVAYRNAVRRLYKQGDATVLPELTPPEPQWVDSVGLTEGAV